MTWYDLNHNEITVEQADELLKDFDQRRIDRTEVVGKNGVWVVSTVFLVLDHGWSADDPVLYETIVIKPDREVIAQVRSTTRENAVTEHNKQVALLRSKESL